MAVQNYPHSEVCRYSGRVDPLVSSLPHYHLVEKDPAKHLQWRLDLYRKASGNKALQRKLWEACRDDPLFFINAFVWIFEPREGEGDDAGGVIPFNTWVHQDPVIASLHKYFGVRHVLLLKSRAQGASWILCAMFCWAFIFLRSKALGMASKDLEAADAAARPGSLGWKIDFIIRMLPPWMRPAGLDPNEKKNRSLSQHSWENPKSNNFISAEAATPDTGRSDRYTVFGGDEAAFFVPQHGRAALANLLQTTNCVWWFSTPNGMDDAFYDKCQEPGPFLTCILDWKDNPWQNRGLYTAKNGRLVFLDKDYDWVANFPQGYPHVLDGEIRSPWFDRKCQELHNDMLLIKRELCMEFGGSVGRPFPAGAIKKMRKEFAAKQLHIGDLEYDFAYPEDVDCMQWLEGEAYKFDLWCPLVGGRPPDGRYYIGVDLSRGVGGETSSNSVISIWNELREQVGELANNTIDPVEFAHLAVAVAYWFGRGEPTTKINWEVEGPGREFGLELKRLGYHNLWMRPVGDDDRRYRRISDTPGYTNKNRDKAIRPLKLAVINQNVAIRSEALLEECLQYVFGDDGQPMHPKAKTARDGSAKGISHGDRVIAAAMAILMLDDLVKTSKRQRKRREMPVPDVIPRDSIAGRMLEREQQKRASQAKMCRW